MRSNNSGKSKSCRRARRVRVLRESLRTRYALVKKQPRMGKTDQGVVKSANRYKAVPRTLSFITHGVEVLLLRGAPTKRIWPNKYNGVGGHVEADEDLYMSAVREMCEETGLDVTDVRLRGVINVDAGMETGILVFVFTAQSLMLDTRPSPEGTLEWIRQDQVKTLDLVEDLPELLPRVLTMQPDDPPFFARYHYEEYDRLVITFADVPHIHS